MTKQTRKKFSKEEKRKAVDDYVSGRKSAHDIAAEIGTEPQAIYRWKTLATEEAKGFRIEELQSQGFPPDVAKKILQMEDEISVYQKKVAEQAVIIDLLKKLQNPTSFQPESELTGLIATTKKLDRKKERAK